MSGRGARSLQRLQALDKDFQDFPSQLEEVYSIIRGWLFAATLRPKNRTADGRLDWSLRWLLTKLKASGSTGEGYVADMQDPEHLLMDI